MQRVDLVTTLRIIDAIAAVGILLCALEYLMTPALLADTGLLSWSVHRLRLKATTHGKVAFLLHRALAYPNVLGLLLTQVLLAILLLVSSILGGGSALLLCLLTWGIAAIAFLLALRSPYGKEGPDDMLILIFVTLGLMYTFNTPVMFLASLWFLAFQGCLSYCTAGVAKVISPVWRNGEALPGIMATAGFGHQPFSLWLPKHPHLTRLLTWSIICLEMAMPLALLGIWWLSLALLFWGFAFHFSNAVLMRLNRFMWTFTATYPAIWYCASTTHLFFTHR